ncbi:MAG TPA: ABC transporter permease [Bryobacteraceae bacterium]|jgi:predicted permease|nr:ABC transporter permease [Bryobacteraceae bacterium]
MNWQDVRESLLRMAGLLQRNRRDRELTEELEFHLALKQQKYMQTDGLAPQQAATQARRDLGGLERWKEVCRDVARFRALEEFGRDLVLAARLLHKAPVFTLVAVFTLTAAIGANTAIFSLLNAILLKPLTVPEANGLAILRIQPDKFGYTFNYPLYQQVEQRARPLFQAFAFTGRDLQLRTNEGVERVAGQLVSGTYFSALQVQPQLGRWIGPGDDRPGAPGGAVAVISHRFWLTHMHSDPQVLGRSLVVNNGTFTIIGVMPDGFRGMNKDQQPDIFVPLALDPVIDAPFNNIAAGYGSWWFRVGARLRPGVSLERVNAFLRTASPGLFSAMGAGADFQFDGHKLQDLYLNAEPGAIGYSSLRLSFGKPLLVLMALVTLVLLIACVNIATLLMARAASRTREIATRFALGASRLRLVRQLLTESFVLAMLATVLGYLSAPFVAHTMAVLFATQRDPLGVPPDVSPDLPVFAFTACMAIMTTLLTGTLPALRSTRDGLEAKLREGSVARRRIWPRALLALEVGLALMLVTGASLLGYSLVKLHEAPIGFEPHGLIYLPLDAKRQAQNQAALLTTFHEIADEVEELPRVTGDSLTQIVPLTGSAAAEGVSVPGRGQRQVWANRIGPGYFRTMRTPLFGGREFQWTDTDESIPVAILNEAAAKKLFPNERALGQRVSLDGKTMIEIVGIVADAKYLKLRDAAPPTLYSPVTQDLKRQQAALTLLVRTTGPPAPVIAAVGKIVRRHFPDIPPPAALSMDQTIADALATERMMAAVALFFGALALLITAIGLYGTLTYATERRTGEIGIRLALGAKPKDIISLVYKENGAIALIGCAVGIAGSLAASKLIASFLYGVSARSPLLFAASAVVLFCVATAASLIPARRAARIDPVAAIRHE